MRRANSFFSSHICSRCRLRDAAAGLFLFLFCTADRLTTEMFSSHGLHFGVEGAATLEVGAGNSFPQSRSKGEAVTKLSFSFKSKGGAVTKLSSASSFSFSSTSNFCFSSSTQERYSSLSFSLVTYQSSSDKKSFPQCLSSSAVSNQFSFSATL